MAPPHGIAKMLALAAGATGLLLLQLAPSVSASSKKHHVHHHEGHADHGLVLEETFSNGFNLDLWKHEITAGGLRGGNWEFQFFSNNRSNSYVSDGALHITPTLSSATYGDKGVSGNVSTTLELWGVSPASQCTSNQNFGCVRASSSLAGLTLPPVQSARVRTANTFSFSYGRLEVEAKLPRGDWLHPSIWLLPELEEYGMWPASGEIDLLSSRGNAPGYPGGGCDTMTSALHFGPNYNHDLGWGTQRAYALGDGTSFADDYHTFGLVWTPEEMYTYVDSDDNRVMEVDLTTPFFEEAGLDEQGMANPWENGSPAAPFDARFYLVMDISVGGVTEYFPDGVGGKPWNNTDPKAPLRFHEATSQWHSTWEDPSLHVRSVRVWKHKESKVSSLVELVQPSAQEEQLAVRASGPVVITWPVALFGAGAGFVLGALFTMHHRQRYSPLG